MKIIQEIPPPQPSNKFVALDLELFGLNPKQLHRPTSGQFACLSIAVDPETVYVVEDELKIPIVFSNLRDTVSVYHHAKFDITHLRRWVNLPPKKKLWDTMLIERIMYGGYFDFFAIEHLARRHLDIKMDKSLQKSFEDSKPPLTKEQIEYAALDASITLQICEAQRKVMRKEDFNIWAKVDRPALWAYMDFMGFAINVAGWKALADKNLEHANKIEETFDYNPRSPKQVQEVLIEHGFKGLPNTQEKTLRRFISKHPDTDAASIADDQLSYKKFQKRHSTYGMNLLEHFIEKDIQFQVDMIYCDYRTIGAETGRTASAKPNMQNIPARDTKEYRKCFIARPNNALIIADYSAQEPSILAYLSQDKRLIEIINSGKDIYIEVAKGVFGETITKTDPRRDKMKSLVLGTNYGMSEYGLARELDISKEDAKILLHKFFQVFPGVASWMVIRVSVKGTH
jgi:DNA polymerase-1